MCRPGLLSLLTRSIALLVFTGLLIIVGCSLFESGNLDTPPPDGSVLSIRTAEDSYRAEVNEQTIKAGPIHFTYTNNSDGAVYIPNCNGPHPPRLHKWVDNEWVFVYQPPIADCLSDPIKIEPGATYDFRFSVSAGHPDQERLFPAFGAKEVDGFYRLVWEIFDTDDDTIYYPETSSDALLPLAQRVSNSFRIKD